MGKPEYKNWGAKWGALMAWIINQQYFRDNLKLGPGGETGPVNDLVRSTTERIWKLGSESTFLMKWRQKCTLTPVLMTDLARVLALLVAVACSHALAAEDDFSDAEALGGWITYYYKSPEPHRVADAMLAASAQGFANGGERAPAFFGFLAGVISKNPAMAEELAQALSALPEADQPILILGIWYSDLSDPSPLLQQLRKTMPGHAAMIDRLLTNGRLRLRDLPLEQGPWVLDALWGNFMATGDDAPVVRIISTLPWIEVRGDVTRLSVGGAARWSLISNAIQHEAVMAVCRREVTTQPKEVAVLLGEVIAEAEKDIRDGKLSMK